MPIYEYRCEKGHTFEVLQRMSDDPVSECEVCGKPVQRVFHPVAVHFKGSGFYNTDYGKQKRGGAAASDDSGGGGGDSKADSSSKKDGASSSSSDGAGSGSGSKAKEKSSSAAATKSD